MTLSEISCDGLVQTAVTERKSERRRKIGLKSVKRGIAFVFSYRFLKTQLH